MKTKLTILLMGLSFLPFFSLNAQSCGIKDPSIERHTSCPTTHSELALKSVHWFNVLNNFISTSDYYYEGQGCNFGSFLAAGGIRVGYCKNCFSYGCYNTYYPGCGRAGIFLNFNDGAQDPKYKEFIGTKVDLVSGRNYVLSIDIQRSNEPSTRNVERDLAIYGYNGPIPAAQVSYCPSGAIALDTIPYGMFNDDTNHTIISTFRPGQAFSYLFIGPVSDNYDAVQIGYVYLDKILLTDLSDSTLTPWIKYEGNDSRSCCFSGKKTDFILVGNKAPRGTTVSWGQKTSNPQSVVFTTPTDSFTRISGTGPMITGTYEYYYTWSKFGCSITDTFVLNVMNNPSANAGVDFAVCNASSFSLNALTPSLSIIDSRSYLSWWSIVDPSKPDGTYSFPLTTPLSSSDQYCDVGPGALTYALNYSITSNLTRLPNAPFSFAHQCDTFQFIWNIVDECNQFSSDTVKVYAFQLKIKGDSLSICPGDTTRYIYEDIDSLYNSKHRSKDSLQYTWSIMQDSGAIHLVGNIHNDSIRVTGVRPGYYTIKLSVYDSHNTQCDSLFAIRTVYVRDTLKLLHPPDIVLCGDTIPSIRQGAAPDGAIFWWDVVDYSQPDSLFTLSNRLFPDWPSDGISNGHTASPISWDSTGLTSSDRYTIFSFPFMYPEDSFTLIYNIINPCDTNDIRHDTVNVRINYVHITSNSLLACYGDTSILLFETNEPVFHNSTTDTSLHYSWRQISGPGPVHFVGDTLSDSIYCFAPNISGTYVVALDLYDSDDPYCSTTSSKYSFTILSVPDVSTTSANVDIHVCNSLLVPFTFLMNASPSIATINRYGFQTWWSLIDYSEPDSEYTFVTGCVPADGFDNGNVSCGFDLTCGNVASFASDAPNCFFTIVEWGCYDFIWHLKYDCNENHIYIEDTVRVCWDFLEPSAFAGNDDTVTCNVYQLNGSTSSASAANSGCFNWHQLTDLSPSHQKISLIDSTNNVAYMIGLDTITPGWYYFEYRIGCSDCFKTDTVAIYIPNSLPTPNIHLSCVPASMYLCPGDSITIAASGADQYQFIVNGLSVTELSPINHFTYGSWLSDTNIIQVIAYDNALGCFSTSDTSLLKIVHTITKPSILTDSIIFCAGSNTYLVAQTDYASQNILWYSSADGFSAALNGPSGTAPGDSFIVSPSIPTLYKGIIFDVASGCKGDDSISVLVTPITVGIPNPIAQNDTSFCITGDSISISIMVSNSLYAGSWTYRSNAFASFSNITNPASNINTALGDFVVIWTENNLGCTGSDSFELHVLDYPLVNAGEDSIICSGKSIRLYGEGDAASFVWLPIDAVENANSLHSKTQNIFQDIYFILEGENGNGLCKSRDTVEIFIQECPSDIKVPDAFSPNGDGINDFFTIFTYKMKDYEIWIFNRWGENLYYSNDLNETNLLEKGWDGRFNGSIQEVGTYVYLIKAVNRDDENIVLKGNLSIVK